MTGLGFVAVGYDVDRSICIFFPCYIFFQAPYSLIHAVYNVFLRKKKVSNYLL